MSGPYQNTTQFSLGDAKSILESLYMPALPEIPLIYQSSTILGNQYSIQYFYEPLVDGDKLFWAALYIPVPQVDAPCFLTLSPFPQGKAADKLLALLQRADRSGLAAEELLPELEALGKEANGVGWRPVLEFPLKRRLEFNPMTYLPPSLETILKNDPAQEVAFLSSRNTNGRYEVCTARINQVTESITLDFFLSEDDSEPRLHKQLCFPIPAPFASKAKRAGLTTLEALIDATRDLQTYFHHAGSDLSISRIERLKVKYNDEGSLGPDATKDDRLRLMRSVRPPFEFSHTFHSGAMIAVEAGHEVVSLMMRSSAHPSASTYMATLDRTKLQLSDNEWRARRDDFIGAARLLASESEGLQPQALERIMALATQQGGMPTKIKSILGEESALLLEKLANDCRLMIRTELGRNTSELRRMCDGSEVLVISRTPGRLGSEDLSLFHDIVFEFKPDGALEFSVHNRSGNRIMGRVSAAGANRVGGRQQVALLLAGHFVKQWSEQDYLVFEDAAQRATSLDPDNSFLLTGGQSPYLDLPKSNHASSVTAFIVAQQCAKRICSEADGYGRHHVAAVGPGKAEARLEFPRAPYDLIIQVADTAIVRADFIPKRAADGKSLPPYSFTGRFDLANSDALELALLLNDFAQWGRDNSQNIAETKPLEETLAFSALKRLLPTELHIH